MLIFAFYDKNVDLFACLTMNVKYAKIVDFAKIVSFHHGQKQQ